MQNLKLKELIKRIEDLKNPLSDKELEILKDIKYYAYDEDMGYEDEDNIALRDNMYEELEIAAEEYPYLKSDLDAFLSKMGYPETDPNLRFPNRH